MTAVIPPPPVLSPIAPVPVANVHKAGSDKVARLGLVLAVVVALAGVIGAVAKGGDESTKVASNEGPAVSVPEGDGEVPTADPLVLPEGFQIVQGDGVYLAVPAEWFTLSQDDVDGLINEDTFEEIYPDLDPAMRDVMLGALDNGAIFMAMDLSEQGAGNNINIITIPGEAPLGLLAAQVEREFEGTGFTYEIHGSESVDTPIGEGLRLSYSIDVLGEMVESVQIYVPADGSTYIVTGTGDVAATDQAIQTLRLGEAPTPA